MELTTGGIIFWALAWTSIMALTVFVFGRLFKSQRNRFSR